MMTKIRKRLNQKGFTLVELMVVIAILGILAAIAVPRLSGFQDTAKSQANKQSANQIKSAVAMGIASGEIKLAANNATYTFRVLGDSSTGVITVNDFTAANFSSVNGVSPATAENMATVLTKYVSELKLKTVNGATQAIGVQINNTAVKTATGSSTTDSNAFDYTVAD